MSFSRHFHVKTLSISGSEAITEASEQNKSPLYPAGCVLFVLIRDIKPFYFVLLRALNACCCALMIVWALTLGGCAGVVGADLGAYVHGVRALWLSWWLCAVGCAGVYGVCAGVWAVVLVFVAVVMVLLVLLLVLLLLV